MPVLHRPSVENDTSYIIDRVSSIPRILRMLGLEYTRFVDMPRILGVLRELYFKDSRSF